MSFVDAIKTCFRKYAVFSGRASRAEFWKFVLLLVFLNLFATMFSGFSAGNFNITFGLHFGWGPGYSWFVNIYSVLFFLPFLSVLSRRFHDTGFDASILVTGTFPLFAGLMIWAKANGGVVPIFLVITFLVILFGAILFVATKKSQPGSNKYGPNPHEVPQ